MIRFFRKLKFKLWLRKEIMDWSLYLNNMPHSDSVEKAILALIEKMENALKQL